jgi:polysaccharide deacetylase 2 family uncharacterized protein YibQ
MRIAALFHRFAVAQGRMKLVRQGLCLLAGVFAATATATATAAPPLMPAAYAAPRIAIIIDDLGDRLSEGKQVVQLPGAVTVSIIPYTPFGIRLALLAHTQQKEIMLHLPMESMDERYLGRGGLSENMNEQQFIQTLYETLDAVPDIRGVNNHMGSRLTQDATKMGWVMSGILRHGELYFVDSRTTSQSQADTVAREYGLDHARRDVFLDDDKDPVQIKKQWTYLLQLARRNGTAVAIGHPYPETIQFLQHALPGLSKQGVVLVPVSELIQWQQTRSRLAWQTQTSSSPSPRVVKNSKR